MRLPVTVTKSKTFSAAHHLPHHRGKCRCVHGHTFTVSISITGPVQPVHDENPESGMVADIASGIGRYLEHLHSQLDHSDLNEWEPYPTAERLLLRITQAACKTPLPPGVYVSRVTLSEGPGVTAEVTLDDVAFRKLRGNQKLELEG